MTEIERNAGNIVRASMPVRQGKRLPCREYDDMMVRAGFDMSDDDECGRSWTMVPDSLRLQQYSPSLERTRSPNPRLQRCAAGNRREAGLHWEPARTMEL